MRACGVMAIGLSLTAATAPPPTIADLHPVSLHPGVNLVPGFLVGGGAATIVQGWRGNGNAHGHHVWLVLGGASEDNGPGVIGVERPGGDPVATTIDDVPFDGERVLGTIRFATARIAGKPATLLIEASLDDAASGIPADHATATIRWFRLSHEDDAIGRTSDAFEPIGTVRTRKRYCNAELALRDAAEIALPPDFAGANRIDGCFAHG